MLRGFVEIGDEDGDGAHLDPASFVHPQPAGCPAKGLVNRLSRQVRHTINESAGFCELGLGDGQLRVGEPGIKYLLLTGCEGGNRVAEC